MNRGLIIISAFLIPGSGHVLLGRPMRGLVFLFWMVIAGFITYHLTGENISFIGRISGGIAIWVISILEAAKLPRPRLKK